MVTGLTHPLCAFFFLETGEQERERDVVLVLAPGCPCVTDPSQSVCFHKPVHRHARTGLPNTSTAGEEQNRLSQGLQNGPLFRHSGRPESPSTPETLSFSHNRAG